MLEKEEFLQNVKDCWAFAIEVAWDQNRRHPELSRGKALEERSFLWTLLGTNEEPIFKEALLLADSCREKENMMELLPSLLAVMEKKYPPKEEEGFEEGRSFRYELNKQNECYLHIRNGKKSGSFLADPAHVAENLRYIMEKARKENGCDTLYTASWLNSFPPFLRYFPEDWQKNLAMTPAGPFGPTLGWQGQFINRFGLLNKSMASKFLSTGVLPYARLESRASFAAVEEHLSQMGL